jgi:sporulation protein YlmC with PRC-barrel domain
VLFVSIGELAGFSAPLALGLWARGMSTQAQLPFLVVGGCIEGAVLGLAQASVLRRVLPGFRTTAWVIATSAAAGIAWLLGPLPSATYATWSTWPVVGVAVAATVLGTALLLCIGVAQAGVMRRRTPGARTWIWWTALGWCGGLVAFSVVAPPLWHEGQDPARSALIGVAGGAAMAVVMAAVTGVGMVRLCARTAVPRSDPGHADSRLLSSIVGTQVRSPEGRHVGQVSDLVIDLAGGQDRVPVTGVVIRLRARADRVVPWDRLRHLGTPWAMAVSESPPPADSDPQVTAATEVWARRDILDSPVVLADPPRQARVSDVVVELDQGGAWVVGIDVSTAGALRRLIGHPAKTEAGPVRLSQVHLVSAAAHSAQLAVPDSMVFRLEAQAMAEVLSRVPVARGRDILSVADEHVASRAVSLLHPHIRSRLTVGGPAPRRTRRLDGWLLRPPDQAGERGTGPRHGDTHRSGPRAER